MDRVVYYDNDKYMDRVVYSDNDKYMDRVVYYDNTLCYNGTLFIICFSIPCKL